MPDTDPALIEITSDVVSAYLAQNHVPSADIPALITSVHGTFADLGRAPAPAAQPEKPIPAVSIKKSVSDDYLVSMEDGKHYKALKRHLRKLGMTPEDYRVKWSLPNDYPMVAPAYARARSQLAKTMGLGQQRRKR